MNSKLDILVKFLNKLVADQKEKKLIIFTIWCLERA